MAICIVTICLLNFKLINFKELIMRQKYIEHFKKILTNQLKELLIHAGDAVDMDTRQLVHSAIVSTVRAFDNLNVNSEDAFRGAGYGVIQGAVEKGMNVVDTAVEAIEGARDAAATLDIAEEKVMGYAVAGVLKGVEEINPRALPKVKKTLPRKLLELYVHVRYKQ